MNIRILYIFAIIVALAGCAKKEDDNLNQREQEAFDIWMAATHPEAEKAENGMYFEWLRQTDEESAATPVTGRDWVTVDYLVRDLDGNIMGTRSEKIAREEGTFSPVAHYVPDFALLQPELRYFTPGEYSILPEMKVGDSVRLYVPSRLAYINANISFVNGYEGWRYSALNPLNAALGVSRIGITVTIDLALRNITSAPEADELELVDESREDMQPVSDTIPGLYYKIVNNDPEASVIPVDSIAWITWTCRFLDGKLVATNDWQVANAEWNDFSDRYLEFDPFTGSSSGSTVIGSALHTAVKHELIRYNSTVKLLFISDFGYGSQGARSLTANGQQAPRPVIFPYTPLTLDVIIMPENFRKEEEEEESEETDDQSN